MNTHLKKFFKRLNNYIILTSRERRHALVGPAMLWNIKRDFQIKFLSDHGLKENHKFLDIGCGTLRGGIPIIRFLSEENYWGIDIRKAVLIEAEKELKDENLTYKNPTLINFKDFSSLEILIKFDIIFAFSVLIHFDDKTANNCFQFVCNHLTESGRFYANVNISERKDSKWKEFPTVFRSKEFYEELAKNAKLSLRIMGKLKDLGHYFKEDNMDNKVMLEFRKLKS